MAGKKALAYVGIAFLLLWPIVGLAIGIGGFPLLLVWLLGAAGFGVAGQLIGSARISKKIDAPVFGELTAPNWKGVACYWNGKLSVGGSTAPIEMSVHCDESGPSSAQRELLEKVIRELPDLKTLAINALRALDRSEWPEAAREGPLELVAIQLEDDEETREGIFSFRFESTADPEAEYFADFRSGVIEEAYRLD